MAIKTVKGSISPAAPAAPIFTAAHRVQGQVLVLSQDLRKVERASTEALHTVQGGGGSGLAAGSGCRRKGAAGSSILTWLPKTSCGQGKRGGSDLALAAGEHAASTHSCRSLCAHRPLQIGPKDPHSPHTCQAAVDRQQR